MNEGTLPNIVVNPRLRPVFRQFVDAAILLGRHWAPLLIIQLIYLFGSVLIVFGGIFSFAMPVIVALFKGAGGDEVMAFLMANIILAGIVILVMIVLISLLGSWAFSASISAISYKEDGMAPIGWSLKRGFKFMIPVFFVILLNSFALVGGFTLLIFPAVILMCGLMFAIYIKVIDDVGIFSSFGTSWEITKGYKWSIFGRFLVFAFAVIFISMACAVGGILPLMNIALIPVQFLFNIAITPYAFAFFYCIYEDLRGVRRGVYPMSGGLTALMVVCWVLGIALYSGVGLFLLKMLHYGFSW